jgi:hypothetical protein
LILGGLVDWIEVSLLRHFVDCVRRSVFKGGGVSGFGESRRGLAVFATKESRAWWS